MNPRTIKIGNRQIGENFPAFIIAEAGVNHNGDPDLAHKLIDAASDAGCDAVKFQTFKTDDVVTKDAPKAEYQKITTGEEESQHEMIARLELAPQVFESLQKHALEKGLIFMSTPFDVESADLLEKLEVPVFKIPSGEITNPLLLRHVARKGKPILMSTGMANLGEVEAAMKLLSEGGAREIALFQCTSNYPTRPEDVNLRAMMTLRDKVNIPVGLSDHSEGIEIAIAAIGMGANMIEKHLTLDNDMHGPDHRASMQPDLFAAMVSSIRKVEKAMGSGLKEPANSEAGVARVARRSLVASRNLPEGTVLTEEHIKFMRPGTGISPVDMDKVLGKTLNKAIEQDHLITMEVLN